MHAVAAAPSVEFYIHGSVEDWPIFMGNVAAASVQSGRKVVFIITTAGDAGKPAAFWQRRELASETSLDRLLGTGAWACAAQTVSGHAIRRCTKANVVVYFVRMPDGNYYDGTGFGFGSLSNLRDLGVATKAIDGSTTYVSWADFTTTLRGVISLESQGQVASTVQVSAPDYDRTINPGDHPDNAATADAVHAAVQAMGWTLALWVDYQSENMPVNLAQVDHDTKQRLFLAYDSVMVSGGYSSDASDPDIAQWLWRTYYRVSSPVPPAAPTSLTGSANSKSRIDLQWVDNANNETGFYVERAPDVAGVAGTFGQVGAVAGNVTSYSDLSVAPGTRYWYRVRAYNDGGTSAYSNLVSVLTPTSQPLPYRGDAYIFAHQDDWQIFASDHTYSSFQNAASMLFIYTTAGDAAQPTRYWQTREKATLASMDVVLGAGTWACANKTIRTHVIWRCTKNATVVYFMRMPDGNYIDGTGYGYGSITNLRNGTPTTALDGSTTYTTYSDFYSTIGTIVDFEFDGQSSPYVKVNASEYDKSLDPNDHPDHNTTGDAVRLAASTRLWDLTYYVGYDTENRPINITTAQHSQKLQLWTAYDNTMTAAGYASDLNDAEYQAWVWRTYFRSLPATSQTINAPSGLAATTVSTSEIDLSWTDNSTNETGFSIERALDNAGTPGTFAVVATTGANTTTYANTGLATGTSYWYRIRAVNSTSSSAYTSAVLASTMSAPPPPPPNAPSGLTLTPVSTSQITLAWTDNSTDETGFSVERAPDNAGSPGVYTVIATLGTNVTGYADAGLSAGTTYWYRVQAFNANGKSAYTTAVSGATLAAPPAAPSGLTLTVASSSQISLAWTDNSTTETGFSIERAPDNAGAPGTFAVIATVAANTTSYASTGLAASTTYWYRVQATSAVGSSGYSNVASATTQAPPPPPPPAAPSGLTLTPNSTSQITLAWTDNSTDETGFSVERAPDNAGTPGTWAVVATLGANVTGYADAGLTAGTTYWYRVRAFNASGNSAYSAAVSGATLAAPPAAPSGLTLAVASSSQITLAWTDNSTNETGFSIERAPDVGGSAGTFAVIATVAANTTTYANTGLAASTTYWYRVQATSAVGGSGYSNLASAATQAAPPPPPAAPSALNLTVVSSSQIHLAWTDNATNENGFRIERAPDAGGIPGAYTEIATVGADVVAYDNTGLTAGNTYWFRVRAYNAGGNSGYSNESSATLPLPKPIAPTGLTATGSSASTVALAWIDNATDETGYLVERAPDAGGTAGAFAQVASLASNTTSWTDTGRSASTTYWYRVRAAGPANSDYSNLASATTASALPNAPSNLVAQTISNVEIDLRWTDNAPDETSVTVQRAPDAGGLPGTYATIATVAPNVGAYKNTGLVSLTTYWYRIRANNAAGSSAWVETKATTADGPPAAPTTLTAKPTTSASTATLAWKDNATNESGFRIEQAPDVNGAAGTFTEVGVVGANVSTYTAAGLTGNRKYWYRVRAYNLGGSSAYSNTASVITSQPTDLTVDSLSQNNQLVADVEWLASTGGHVDVYRNGVKVLSNFTDTGSWYDRGLLAGVTYTYLICNVGLTTPDQCSNTQSIRFSP